MIERLTQIPGGWFPRLSADGTRIAFGFGRGVGWAPVERDAVARWLVSDGFPCGWFSDTEIMFQREYLPHRGVYVVDIHSGQQRKISDLVGTQHDCVEGNWGLNQPTTGKVFWNGREIASSDRLGVSVCGNRLTTRRHIGGDVWIAEEYENGELRRSFDPPYQDNIVRAIEGGLIAYGYFGRARIVPNDSTVTEDVSVTPNVAGCGEGLVAVSRGWAVNGCEVGGDNFMALRPIGEKTVYRINTPCVYPALRVVDDSASGSGRTAIVAGNGTNGLLSVFRVTLDGTREPIAPPQLVIPPIDRAVWLAPYVFGPVPTSLFGNAVLPVGPEMTVRTWSGRPIASYVQGEPDGDVASLERNARAARQKYGLPVVGYWTAKAQRGNVPSDLDWVGIEAYKWKTESDAQFIARMERSIGRCPRAALICQGYTSNSGNTAEIAGLVPLYADLARRFPQIVALLVFSGAGRATGLQDHAEAMAAWRKLAATVTTPKAATGRPKVTIEKYSPVTGIAPLRSRAVAKITGAGATVLVWRYRKVGAGTWTVAVRNPARDLDHTFTFDKVGQYEIGVDVLNTDGDKTDGTGLARRVTVV